MKNFINKTLKTILLAITIILSTQLYACDRIVDLTPYISELRQDIYYFDNTDYQVFVYKTIREYPYIPDGISQELFDYISIKFKIKNEDYKNYQLKLGNISFDFDIKDNEYYLANQKVEDDILITSVVIVADSNEQTFTLTSFTSDGIASYTKILNILSKNQRNYIKEHEYDGKLSLEVYIRLLYLDDKLFWYVALIDDNSSLITLFDDKGSMITEKTIKH